MQMCDPCRDKILLRAAAARENIGRHFPDIDPAYKDFSIKLQISGPLLEKNYD